MTEYSYLYKSPTGKVPVFGRNDCKCSDAYPRSFGHGFYSKEDDLAVHCIGGGKDFAAINWNEKMVKLMGDDVVLDAPPGWRAATLAVEASSYTGRRFLCYDLYVAFHTNHPDIFVGDCIIDRDRYLHDLTVYTFETGVIPLPLPVFKRVPGIYAYATQKWKSNLPARLVFEVTNARWQAGIQEALKLPKNYGSYQI